MFKKSLVTTALALAVAAWATPASAVTIQFDPTGAGGPGLAITALDPTVGNSIALGATGASLPGTDVTALFQANLTSAKNGSTSVALGAHFGVVAGFHETIFSNTGGDLKLILNPAGPSFFDIYALPVDGDDLTGMGFINGTPILSGVFILTARPGDGISTFSTTSNLPGTPLDANGANDYPATQSITGGGSFDTTVKITGVNAGYFPGLNIGTTLALVTSQLKLNYDQADPSRCFSSDGATQCNQVGVGTVGLINGVSGPNTMFQTDASASFVTATAVPEPATLTLLGIGGLLAARRRRNQAK
jgi:hypothetical protein